MTIDTDALRDRLYGLELSLHADHRLTAADRDLLVRQLDRVDRLITELATETAP